MMIVICVLLLFFFFKQKTAYEMRISDWSSDVCSSDLLITSPGNRQEAERYLQAVNSRLEYYREWLGSPQGSIRQVVYLPLAPVMAEGIGNVQFIEIGRASCRERGCQYV